MSKITYEIYQMKDNEKLRDLIFEGSRYLNRIHMPVHPDHYDKVYSGSINSSSTVTGNPGATSEVLESLYEKFNLYHPADFRGHSLSVSDVIVLNENGHTSAHLCDSFGFKEVPEFLMPTAPSPVLSPPSIVGEQNYLKNAEEYLEENYNNITGMISTQNKLTPGDDTLPHPEYLEEQSVTANESSHQTEENHTEERPSVLAKLRAVKEEIPEKPSPDALIPTKTNELSIE